MQLCTPAPWPKISIQCCQMAHTAIQVPNQAVQKQSIWKPGRSPNINLHAQVVPLADHQQNPVHLAITCKMQFSLGHLLELLDKTLLNPFLSIFIPVGLHLLTASKISVHATPDALLTYKLNPLPPLQSIALKLLFAGLVLRINRTLSHKALNNGVKAQFDWDKEIVLITGAAGGIGAEAAQRFASRGSKVVVLDVLPLTYPKRTKSYCSSSRRHC